MLFSTTLAGVTSIIDSIPITPDTVRLLIIPVFIYGAYLDVRARRVYNEFWIPLLGLCFIVLGWDAALILFQDTMTSSNYLLSFALSIIIVPSIAFTLWQVGVLGGADLKALAFLSVFFPTQPMFDINGTVYPLTDGLTPIFTVTILVNALIISSLYRLVITGQNILDRNLNTLMTRAIRYPVDEVQNKHGYLLSRISGSRLTAVDLDVVRMYLRWRGITLDQLRENSMFYRETTPEIRHPFGDGAVENTAETPLGRSRAGLQHSADTPSDEIVPAAQIDGGTDDPWGAETFTEELSETGVHSNTPVSADELRVVLETLTEKKTVWVSPAIPFFVPITIGLIIALTYGSIFTGVTEFIAGLIIDYLGY